MENVTIRPAMREDMIDVMDMIEELAEYKKNPDGPKVTLEILERDGFDAVPPLFVCYIADIVDDDTYRVPIGYALCYYSYSTWEGKSLMLEDIFMRPNYRMAGAGKKMMKALAKLALDTECSRLDLHVLKWNKARKFYELLGAVNLTETEEWLFYRISKNSLINLSTK